jgi:hypothetical protein
MSVHYTLQNDNDYIVVNGDLSDYPDITLSDTNTFEFYLKEDGLSVDLEGGGSAGGTYAGTAAGGTYGGNAGLTYAGLGKTVSDTAATAYNRLKEYQKYAGYATTGATQGASYFSENPDVFDRAPIDGIVIAVVPGDDVDEARGVWGIIESIDDTTEIFGAVARITVDLFVVAEFNEYGSEEQVRNAFESDF